MASTSLSTRIAMPSMSPRNEDDRDSQQRRYLPANTSQYQQQPQQPPSSRLPKYGPRRTSVSAQASRTTMSLRLGRTFQVRLTRRQIVFLLGSLLAIIVLLRQQAAHRHNDPKGTSANGLNKLSSSSKSRKSSNDKGKGRKLPSPFSPQGIPIVDRDILRERIRQIEAEGGWIDEDEDEARSAGRLPMRYSPGRPAVLSIPDGKPRNRPKLTDQDVEAHRLAHAKDATLVDKEFCPDQVGGCKFLLPAWLGEQETKAQMHLYQLGLLATALNRTLVLPNVSKSRMMSCASQPFEFYYDSSALQNMGIPSITFQRFTEWSSKRRELPTAQIVAITNPNTDYSAGALEVDPSADPSTIPAYPKRKLCLEPPKAYLNFTAYSPMIVYPPSNWHKQSESRFQFGESLINTLQSSNVLQQSYRSVDGSRFFRWFGLTSAKKTDAPAVPDTLVFNYELRYPILHHEQIRSLSRQPGHAMSHPNVMDVQDFRHFDYSHVWTDLAQQVTAKLSPFIAIHWRQETLPSSIIAPCALSLVDKLEDLLSSHNGALERQGHTGIKTIYLATDYPIEDLQLQKENSTAATVAHSGTFSKLLTEEHHTAMRDFLNLFKERIAGPLGVRLTTFSSEQTSLKISADLLRAIAPPPPALTNNGRPRRKGAPKLPASGLNLEELDVGLLGIIDKTVAMGAEIFLTGQPWSNDKEVQETACAKESSFTKQISEARRLRRSRYSVEVAAGMATSDSMQKGRLWNDVDYWSRDG